MHSSQDGGSASPVLSGHGVGIATAEHLEVDKFAKTLHRGCPAGRASCLDGPRLRKALEEGKSTGALAQLVKCGFAISGLECGRHDARSPCTDGFHVLHCLEVLKRSEIMAQFCVDAGLVSQGQARSFSGIFFAATDQKPALTPECLIHSEVECPQLTFAAHSRWTVVDGNPALAG